ncbi:MAG: hypothetical protein PHV34_16940 [Verrucomicrobiae bacterium]|nr:hypothetical protein [Verrucomicrobiae bacterium]
MSNSSPHLQPVKVRVISSTAAQQVAWPAVDQSEKAAVPVALPKEPVTELVQGPDGKTRIIVTCSCGKRIEILCET